MFQTKQGINESGSADPREKLISQHVDLIRFYASGLSTQLPPGIGVDELLNAGVLGLIGALTSYESNAGFEFKTCADQHIQAAMVKRLRELNSRPYRISSTATKSDKTSQALEVESLAEAKDLELCRAMRINLDQLPTYVFTALFNGVGIGSFSDVSKMADQADPSKRLLSYHPEGNSECSWVLEKTEILKRLAAGVDDLPPKERLVASLHYLEELTIKEISTILRMPEWKILQLHTKAMLPSVPM